MSKEDRPLAAKVRRISKSVGDGDSRITVLKSIDLDVRWQRHSKTFHRIYRMRRVAPQKEASAFATTFAAAGR